MHARGAHRDVVGDEAQLHKLGKADVGGQRSREQLVVEVQLGQLRQRRHHLQHLPHIPCTKSSAFSPLICNKLELTPLRSRHTHVRGILPNKALSSRILQTALGTFFGAQFSLVPDITYNNPEYGQTPCTR